MGEVYRARDARLARDVAIKILPEAFVADADRLARFEREARLLAALNHPHIGAIYGFEDREGVHALVLELVEGETLADGLTRGPLPVRVALAIARQIADALEAAHEKEHHPSRSEAGERDPSHARFDPRQRAAGGVVCGVWYSAAPRARPVADDVTIKVIDFGLAKGNDEPLRDLTYLSTLNAGRTGQGGIFGTAGYMSPEQARGAAVDKRSDIWAFGCILYEMLTGRKAFAADTLSDTLVAVLERQPDWSAVPLSTPPAIQRLVRRCLEKDLKRRLHDIADARTDVDDAFRQEGPGRSLPPVAPPAWGFARPRAGCSSPPSARSRSQSRSSQRGQRRRPAARRSRV